MKILVLTIIVSMLSTAAFAQANATSEQQLNNGFLGDQNFRLTSQDAPSDASYAARAASALAKKDYAGALAILRPYKRSHDLAYYFLAGQAYQGLGDTAAARKAFTEALRRRKTFLAASYALGMLEAELGDPAAAIAILNDLSTRKAKCGESCQEASLLSTAIAEIEAALRARSK